jgi:hypothetical protein
MECDAFQIVLFKTVTTQLSGRMGHQVNASNGIDLDQAMFKA